VEQQQVTEADIAKYRGMVGAPLVAATLLEPDVLRRFVQAVMDGDALYYDVGKAKASKFGGLAAPPLYPVHAFRRAPDGADPLAMLQEDADADGSAGNDGMFFGLPPIETAFKRLLNGGNEIEFYRNLAVDERCVAKARYANVNLKQGKSGTMLLVDVETEFRTEAGELLLINRQTLIWR